MRRWFDLSFVRSCVSVRLLCFPVWILEPSVLLSSTERSGLEFSVLLSLTERSGVELRVAGV